MYHDLIITVNSKLLVEAEAQCQRGDIRPVGMINRTHLVGHMELCDGDGMWRKICGQGWGGNDTRVACRQMGFSDQGKQA